MEENEHTPIEKIYFGIQEVSDRLNIPISTLRYYDNEFEILKLKKNSRGERFFNAENIELVKLIYHLVHEKGYTVEGARKKLLKNINGEFDSLRTIQALEKIRSFLVDLKNEMEKTRD